MDILSMKEFDNVCKSLSPDRFVFSSENQDWDGVHDNIKVISVFKDLLTTCNPNAIYLKGIDSSLRIERVKYIKMDKERSVLGTVFTIVCGSFSNDRKDGFFTNMPLYLARRMKELM